MLYFVWCLEEFRATKYLVWHVRVACQRTLKCRKSFLPVEISEVGFFKLAHQQKCYCNFKDDLWLRSHHEKFNIDIWAHTFFRSQPSCGKARKSWKGTRLQRTLWTLWLFWQFLEYKKILGLQNFVGIFFEFLDISSSNSQKNIIFHNLFAKKDTIMRTIYYN